MNAAIRRFTTILAVAVLLSLLASAQQPRRIQRVKTFTAPNGAFQFSHPANFQVCTAGDIQPCIRSYIPVCEQDSVICAVYPSERFGDTSFGAASFQVREVRAREEQMTPDICATQYPPKFDKGVSEYPEFLNSTEHPTENIGGVQFVHEITGDAAMSHSSSVDVFRVFHGQRCFELRLSETETSPDVYDPPKKTLTRAERRGVHKSLSQVLHSFRFLKN